MLAGSATRLNRPKVAKKWSWPLLPLVGTKSRIDQAFTRVFVRAALPTASVRGRVPLMQGGRAIVAAFGSKQRPEAAPTRILASA